MTLTPTTTTSSTSCSTTTPTRRRPPSSSSSPLFLLPFLSLLLLLPHTTTAGKTNVSTTTIPQSDDDCIFDYRNRKCEPASHCHYKYRFLDATFSESCRLKNAVVHAKPLYKSKLTASPALIATGATTLFGLDIAAIIFTPLLQNFPITFNLIQGFILCLAGDTYFQILEQGGLKAKKVGVRIYRALRSGAIGALNNGLIHYLYYKWIDRRFPYHLFTEEKFGKPEGTYYKLSVAWAKYWIEWPTIGVYKIASMMFFTALLGGNMKGLGEKFKKRFMLTWLRSLQVWPVYDTILYAYVPASHRPLFNTFMSIVWGGYLSHISQAEEGGALKGLDAGEEWMEDEVDKLIDNVNKGAQTLSKGVHDTLTHTRETIEDGVEAVNEKIHDLADQVHAHTHTHAEKVKEAVEGVVEDITSLHFHDAHAHTPEEVQEEFEEDLMEEVLHDAEEAEERRKKMEL